MKTAEAATQAGFSIFHFLLCTSALHINAYKNVCVCVETLCFVVDKKNGKPGFLKHVEIRFFTFFLSTSSEKINFLHKCARARKHTHKFIGILKESTCKISMKLNIYWTFFYEPP